MGMDGADRLQGGGVVLDAHALKLAHDGFHTAFPRRSARRVLHVSQIIWMCALAGGLAWALRADPQSTLSVLYVLALALFAVLIAWRLIAAASLTPVLSRIATAEQWPIYTILCPLYREADGVGALADALARLDYPRHALDIKFLVEQDDHQTVAAALAHAGADIEVVILPPATPRTKPKALNAGLHRARGAYLTIYDAEDRPHPLQLRAAIAAFEDGGADLACVQAPLAIDNAHCAWVARQFAAEYAIQFHEILPMLARLGLPLPLGGTSNHFRVSALRAAAGWDAYNVTEDADLGYRLARDGWRSGVISPPTWEEAPIRLPAWLNQRTRWVKGHIQTWLVLMRNPVRALHEMGLGAFLGMHLTLTGGLAATFVHGPIACIVLVAALSPYALLTPVDFALALAGYSVAIFASLSATALSGNFSHLRAALTMPLYWPLASLAAYRALFELFWRPHYWAKTDHGLCPRPVIRWREAALPREPATDAPSVRHPARYDSMT